MEARDIQKKNDYCIYETFFLINLKVSKHIHIHQTETLSIEKEETEEKRMEYYQTKTIHRNTKE